MTHHLLALFLAATPVATKPAAPAAPAAAPTINAGEVVARMQNRYDATKDFRARFTQKFTKKAFGRSVSRAGEVLIKKPGKVRWNYEKPDKEIYVSSGQTLWYYNPEDGQAIQRDLKSSQLPAELSFLAGKGKLAAEFDVRFAPEIPYGPPGHHKLSLTRKQKQSAHQAIYFIVDPKDYLVRETVLVDVQGNVNHFVFTDVAVNTKIPDATFNWTPPAGVRTIDGGKLGS